MKFNSNRAWGILVFLLICLNVFFFLRHKKIKTQALEFKSQIDSLTTKKSNDSLLILQLYNTNVACSNNAMDKVRYYEKKMNEVYSYLDKNKKVILDLQKRKELINSNDWNKEKLIDFIENNY